MEGSDYFLGCHSRHIYRHSLLPMIDEPAAMEEDEEDLIEGLDGSDDDDCVVVGEYEFTPPGNILDPKPKRGCKIITI